MHWLSIVHLYVYFISFENFLASEMEVVGNVFAFSPPLLRAYIHFAFRLLVKMNKILKKDRNWRVTKSPVIPWLMSPNLSLLKMTPIEKNFIIIAQQVRILFVALLLYAVSYKLPHPLRRMFKEKREKKNLKLFTRCSLPLHGNWILTRYRCSKVIMSLNYFRHFVDRPPPSSSEPELSKILDHTRTATSARNFPLESKQIMNNVNLVLITD